MILAIDPGSTESGYCFIKKGSYIPFKFGKVDNDQMSVILKSNKIKIDALIIEMIASYGMPVGAEVFETCVWIGRFMEISPTSNIHRIKRLDVKHNICHSSRANDTTIRRALIDRFAFNVRNHGKGTKKDPGFFYNFRADIWAAYAVGITYLDKEN